MTASSVASVKIEREQLEELARALFVPVPATGSGAALFRLCLERVWSLNLDAAKLLAARLDKHGTANAAELAALRRFRTALGGLGEADATEEPRGAPTPPDAC